MHIVSLAWCNYLLLWPTYVSLDYIYIYKINPKFNVKAVYKIL